MNTYVPDVAVTSSNDDLLKRTPFAALLGDSLLSYNDEHSLIIGLYGPWGSGKTSLVNLMLQHINEKTKNTPASELPIILNFNPWNFSNQDQLIGQFFSLLINALNEKDLPKTKELAQKIRMYSYNFMPRLFNGNELKNVFHLTGKLDFSESKSLKAISEEISKTLASLPCKIIIVIDDIDRLVSREVVQVFQLIKSIANFPNIFYILPFDKKIVSSCLASCNISSPDEFLEKIIQIPIVMPNISQFDIDMLFISKMKELIINAENKIKWDENRWRKCYSRGIRYLVKNIRQINRLINVLRLNLDIITDHVNAIDYIVLTTFQVTYPDLYTYIGAHKNELIGVWLEQDTRQEINDFRSKWIKNIQSIVKEQDFHHIFFLLENIFPKLDNRSIEFHFRTGGLTMYRKESRICCKEYFDYFYELNLKENIITQLEIKDFLENYNDKNFISSYMTEISNRNNFYDFIKLIQDHIITFTDSIKSSYLKTICGYCDFFSEKLGLDFIYGDFTSFVDFILENVDNPLFRKQYLIEIFDDSNSSILLKSILIKNLKDKFLLKNKYNYLTIEEIKVLEDNLFNSIIYMIKNDKFFSYQFATEVLSNISNIEGNDAVFQSIRKNKNDSLLLKLITSSYKQTYDSSPFAIYKDEKQSIWKFKGLFNVISQKDLEKWLEQLLASDDISNLTDFDKTQLNEILQILKI